MRVRSTAKHHAGHRGYRAVQPDMMAVENAIDGFTQPKLYPCEIRLAVRALKARGFNGLAIARRIGCSDATVYRHLRAIRDEAAK